MKFVEFGAQHRETVMLLHGGGLFFGGQILAEMLPSGWISAGLRC